MKKYLVFALALVPVVASANLDKDLYYGMHDSQVQELQEFLTDQKVYSGPITGNFYALTRKAVRDFQTANSINPTGYFGPLTRAKANELLSAVTDESGTPISPAITAPKTTDDIVTILSQQIALLQQQLAQLQKNQNELAKQNQTFQTIQQRQASTTAQVVQQAQVLAPTPAVPTIPATPTQPSQSSQSSSTPSIMPPVPPAVVPQPPAPIQSPPPSPTIIFSTSPTSIILGQQSTLSWQSQNTEVCTTSGGWTGNKEISGTQIVYPKATTTYSISCSGKGGNVSKQVTIAVVPVPPAPISTPPTTCQDILCDNFDSYLNGQIINQGWVNRANGAPYVIEDSIKALGNFNTNADSVITKTGSNLLMDGKQSFWVYAADRANWGSYSRGENVQIRLNKGSWDSPSWAVMAFMKDGHVGYVDPVPDIFVPFDTYNDNAWNLAEIEWRSSDQKARYRVNERTWSNWITMRSPATFSGFDTVGFVTFYLGTGGVYFDDLH